MPVRPIDLKLQNKKKEEVQASDVIKENTKVMLYFSAHWCPPCRQFTPVLADFYAEAQADAAARQQDPIECVFVSCDRDEKSMWDYFSESHGDYYVVPYSAPEREALSKQYGVSGIPCLVVVDANGEVLVPNARQDVQSKGPGCIKGWKK